MLTRFLSSSNHMRANFMLTVVLTVQGHAAEVDRLNCPPSVPITMSPAGVHALQDWRIEGGRVLYLNSATPIAGPPEQRGNLAEYTSRRGKNVWSYTYNLERDFPDGKWLECGYGTHNQLTLSRRLPDAIKACTFLYRRGEKAGQFDVKIDCR